MYELCLRQVVAKPLIQICENGTVLPFDIKDNRTIFFENDMLGVSELKKEIEKSLEEIDYNKEYKDNPIYNGMQMGILLKDSKDENTSLEVMLLQEILSKFDKQSKVRLIKIIDTIEIFDILSEEDLASLELFIEDKGDVYKKGDKTIIRILNHQYENEIIQYLKTMDVSYKIRY